MTVFAISMVKDEADIIATTVTRMAAQCDEVLVIDNGSTDGTRELLDTLPCRVFDDPDVAFWQETKITALAHRAADMGAEWVVPFDADEVWEARGRLADVLPEMRCHVARAVWVDYVPTGRDSGADPVAAMRWRRRRPNRLQKVAARTDPALTIAMGNHEAHYGGRQVRHKRLLVARHYPIRSPEQWISKIRNGWAALQATDLPEDQGHHWRRYGRILDAQGPDGLRALYQSDVFVPHPQLDRTLVHDPAA